MMMHHWVFGSQCFETA